MKLLGAFGLGVFSFLLFMFVGESVSLMAGFIALALYFFLCQFLLSRGNPEAHHEDWPIMLSLDAVMLVCLFFMIAIEKQSVIFSQAQGILVSTCGGTYAGAVAASFTARRAALRH